MTTQDYKKRILFVITLVAALLFFVSPAEATFCQEVNTTLTLDNNVSSWSNCFNITAHNVVIDCQGFTVLYANASVGIGINNSEGYDNLTIKNCNIVTHTNATAAANQNNYGIYLNNNINSTIDNNTIFTNGYATNYGIYLLSSFNSSITRNTVTTNGTSGNNYGIYLFSGTNHTVENNSIRTGPPSAANNYGIWIRSSNRENIIRNKIISSGTSFNLGIILFPSSNNNTVENNSITTNGTTTDNIGIYIEDQCLNNTIKSNSIVTAGTSTNYGIYLSTASNFTKVISNTIVANGSTTKNYGIRIDTSSANNTLQSNDILSLRSDFLIFDSTTDEIINYFVYNNTWGEVRWLDNGTGSFLRNLTLNLTNDAGISSSKNMFIGNNTAALNTSAFTELRINSSANITFNFLGLPQINRIMKVNNYTTSSSFINENGNNCATSTCSIVSYDSSIGSLIFNTTSFSSFSGNNTEIIKPLVTILNSANNSNFTSGNQSFNVSIFEDTAIGIVLFSVSNTSGTPFNITSLTNNSGNWNTAINMSALTEGTQIMTVFANDTNNNLNNTVSIYFNVDRTPPNASFVLTFANNSNFTDGNRVVFNASVIDGITGVFIVNLSFSNLTGNGGTAFNRTAANFSGMWNVTFEDIGVNFTDGLHRVYIMANDFVNNSNRTTDWWFNVDTLAPNVSILTSNGTKYSRDNASKGYNATISDVNYIVSVIFMFSNDSNPFNLTAANVSGNWNLQFNASALPEGAHNITVFANDSAGNQNQGQLGTFVVDRTAPSISLSKSGSSTATTLVIDISTSADAQTCFSSRGSVSGSGSSQTITDNSLNPDTTYSFDVSCQDDQANSATASASFRTDGGGADGSSGGGSGGGSSGESSGNAQTSTETPISETPIEENLDVEIEEDSAKGEQNTPSEESESAGIGTGEAASQETASQETFINREPVNTPETVLVSFTNHGTEPIILEPSIREKLTLLGTEERILQIIKDQGRTLESIQLIAREDIKFIIGKTSEILYPASGISYSPNLILGNLLQSKLLNSDTVIVNPQETVKKEFNIRPGITTKEQNLDMIFSSQGKEVITRELKREKLLPGSALDINVNGHFFDVYFIIPAWDKQSGKMGNYKVELNINDEKDNYLSLWGKKMGFRLFLSKFLLNMMWKERTVFSELYGNYKMKDDKGFIFAQQIKYNPAIYKGEYKFTGKIYRNDALVAENWFIINLDTGEVESYVEKGEETKNQALQNRLTVAVVFESNHNISITEYESIIESAPLEEKREENFITGFTVTENKMSEETRRKMVFIFIIFSGIFCFIAFIVLLEKKIMNKKSTTPNMKNSYDRETRKNTPDFSGEERRQNEELRNINIALKKSLSDSFEVLGNVWNRKKHFKTADEYQAEKKTKQVVQRISPKMETIPPPPSPLQRIEHDLRMLKQGIMVPNTANGKREEPIAKRRLTEEKLEKSLQRVRAEILNTKAPQRRKSFFSEQKLLHNLQEIETKIKEVEIEEPFSQKQDKIGKVLPEQNSEVIRGSFKAVQILSEPIKDKRLQQELEKVERELKLLRDDLE